MKVHSTALVVACLSAVVPASAEVKLSSTPDGGIQPKTVADASGTTHLLSFRGEAAGGDLFYSTRGKGDVNFGSAVRVNSTPHSAVSMGTIRGGQFAIGKDGVVHVVWNGSRTQKKENAPLFYSHSVSGGAFEAQQAMSGKWIMDGGGAVAADRGGRVYVFYHGGRGRGEDDRRVLMRASDDSGRTFAQEKIVSPDGLGVCACCSMQASIDSKGRLFVIYRAASDGGRNRDITVLFSADHGSSWSHSTASRWPIAACPMSSMSIAEVGGDVWVAWEKEGQVFVAAWDDGKSVVGTAVAMPGQAAGRKHPVIIAGSDPEQALVAWTEGTGWNRGGSVAWQMIDAKLQPVGQTGHASGVPVWSFVTGVPLANGDFELLH